jgi:hypothetical protein
MTETKPKAVPIEYVVPENHLYESFDDLLKGPFASQAGVSVVCAHDFKMRISENEGLYQEAKKNWKENVELKLKITSLTKALALAAKYIEGDDCYCSEFPGKDGCYRCSTLSEIAEVLG